MPSKDLDSSKTIQEIQEIYNFLYPEIKELRNVTNDDNTRQELRAGLPSKVLSLKPRKVQRRKKNGHPKSELHSKCWWLRAQSDAFLKLLDMCAPPLYWQSAVFRNSCPPSSQLAAACTRYRNPTSRRAHWSSSLYAHEMMMGAPISRILIFKKIKCYINYSQA